MDNDRETAADTLRDARRALADLILGESEHGPTLELAETRRVLQAEIHAFETALEDWDEWASGAES